MSRIFIQDSDFDLLMQASDGHSQAFDQLAKNFHEESVRCLVGPLPRLLRTPYRSLSGIEPSATENATPVVSSR